MKKVLINFAIIITFIFVYFLQANFFTSFKIAGVMPNLFVILIIYIGMFMNRTYAVAYGVLFGVLLDTFIGKKIGVTSIALSIIGIISVIFEKNFSKDNRITIMFIIAINTIVFESCIYFLNYIINSINIEILSFIRIVLIEVMYNIILGIILYPLIQFTGYDIEEEIKGSKLLTKYF